MNQTIPEIKPQYPIHGFRWLGKPIPMIGNILIIACNFGLKAPQKNGWLNNVLSLYNLRNFLYTRILQSANLRQPEWQLGYIYGLLEHKEHKLNIVCLSKDTTTVWPALPNINNIIATNQQDLIKSINNYDTVILSYPDPLGLGWGHLEKQIMHKAKNTAIILNGRGRLIALTPKNLNRFAIRRFLARTRLLEFLLALCVLPCATFLAFKDFLQNKT